MKEKVTQNDRLDYLLDAFKEDSKEYRNLKIPNDLEEKNIFHTTAGLDHNNTLTHKAGVVATASHSDNKTQCDILMT